MPYRDAEQGARARLAVLREQRRDELARVPPGPRLVYRRRVARQAAARAGLVLAAPVAAASVAGIAPASALLVLLVVGMAATWLAARRHAADRFDETLRSSVEVDGALWDDLRRLEDAQPARLARALADGEEQASVALPLVTASVLAPFTLYLLGTALGTADVPRGAEARALAGGFLAVAGVLHLGMAGTAWRFAVRVRRSRRNFELRRVGPWNGWDGLGIAVGSVAAGAMIMFAVIVGPLERMNLYGILVLPTIAIVEVLLFPLAVARMCRAVEGERAALWP